MRAVVAGATITVAGMALVSEASGQSLADVARREADRRKQAAAGKSYTNDSLRPEPASSSVPQRAAPSAPADAAAPATSEPADASKAANGGGGATPRELPDAPKDEAAWRKRIKDARDGVERSQTFVDALQSRVNALTNDFVGRDDPAQRNVIAADRQKALAELARVQAELAGFAKSITAIQEEARRAGVPAGWVR